MTNKEASEWFKKRAQAAPMPGAREVFNLAAEALANADVPGKNVGDTISRQAAIEDIRTMNPKDAQLDIKWVEMWLKQLPSAQPEPKRGAWINEGRIIRCNRCKIGYATVKGMKSALTYNFCPNCGAKMEGEQDD